MKRIIGLFLALAMLISVIASGVSFVAYADDPELDDYDKLRMKWQFLATGGDYDENDPNMKVLLNSINDVAADLLARINKNPVPGWGANDYLWLEYMLGQRNDAYSDSNNTQFSLRNVKNMAMAYQTKGCALYQDETLKSEILRALDYLYVNHFKPGVDTNAYGNWFTWEIGGPIYLCEATLYMFDHLTSQQIQNYADTARKGTKETVDTGANALWRNRVRMLTAILRKNNTDLVNIKNAVPNHIGYTTSGDGYHLDGTFIQHDDKVYNGGYGKEALSDISHFLYLLEGSPWEITDARKENIYTFVYDHYAPFMYKSVFMDMTRGREITRTDTTDAFAGITIALSVGLISEFAPPEHAANYRGMIKAWMSNDYAMKILGEGAGVAWYMFPVYNFSKILEILADDTVVPYEFKESRQFGYGVRTVHATDKFTFGLAMYNNRNIANNETGDSNTRGWYTGTGTYWIYTPDIGQFTLSKPTMNWYRFPGTTVVRNYNASFAKNPNNYAGGTTIAKKYSVSGLITGPGHIQVQAKKSWFMFDDEVVALGTDITSTQANPVETIIEQRRIEIENDLIIDGVKQPATLGWNSTISNPKWLHLEGNVPGSGIGVYFPVPQTLTAIRQTQSGRWTDHGTYNIDNTLYSDDYVTLLFDHGARPSGASYAYVLLPGAIVADVAEYAQDSPIEIIRQDSEVHAVYQKSLNVVGANFFTDGVKSIDAFGQKDYLTIDRAASVMVSETPEELAIAVTDTTQLNNGVINITIDRSVEGVVSFDPRVEIRSYSPSVVLRIDVSNSVGAPIETVLTFLPPDPPDAPSIKDMIMVDDTLTVNINPVPRAEGYILRYGTTSGIYTNELVVSAPSAKVTGLLADTTYYFVAQAYNKSGQSPLSEQQSYKVGLTRVLVDDFADYSKIVSYSSGWAFDATNAAQFDGDVTRLKRDEAKGPNRPEEIVYFAPSPVSFELITYDYGVVADDSARDTLLQFYGSPDNKTWTLIPAARSGSVGVNAWRKIAYTNAGSLDPGIKFIKILVDRNEKIWAPQLSQFTVTYANVPDRVLIDTMVDDNRVYMSTGQFSYLDVSALNWPGISNAIMKNDDEPMSLVYSVTDIQNFRISTVLTAPGTPEITFETSVDGVTFSDPLPIAPGSFTTTQLSGGAILYEGAADLSGDAENISYVKLTFNGAGVYVTNLYLEYYHRITPISNIRYADADTVVVIEYPETPRLKIAPMNGYGEVNYVSGNEDIVTVDADGKITGKDIGQTVVTASILGAQKNAELVVATYRDEARLKTATASSATSGYPATNAVNGNMLTRWQSSGGGTQWLKVDLGRVISFVGVDIEWQQYATNYIIQGSTDDTTWHDLYSETAGTSGNKRVFFDETQSFRYIRVYITAGPGLYSLFEIRALSNLPQEPLVNLALGQPASASGVDPNDASVRDPQLAIDGNTSTRFATARTDSQWFVVDLGKVYPIYEINIMWETASGREYKVQVSDVNDDWNNATDIVHVTDNSGAGWRYYTLPEVATGRYVRMLGISRTTQYGYSMYEFEVMGFKTEVLRDVAFTSAVSNGAPFTQDTTELTITLDKVVTGLSTADFTVTGATKGALDTSAAPVYKLAISDISVLSGETINVSISKAGLRFVPGSRDVVVYKYAPLYEMRFKQDGHYTESLTPGDLSVEARVNSVTDGVIECNVFIALYQSGRLVAVEQIMQKVEYKAGVSSIITTASINVPSGIDLSSYTVKGFLWDADMIPLVAAAML